jgi:dTDP-4-amino-4,6-dideoxygalactose transaminase
MKIANKHGLKLISDTAQAPGALYKGKRAGTLAHIGGFSLNYHKHIHTGEGGVLVTNDDLFAERLQLIRNHAEAVVEGKGINSLANMIGYNFRLGEIECAIGIEQLKKLSHFIDGRQQAANKLNQGLSRLTGLKTPVVASGCTHVFYVYPLQLNIKLLGVSRDRIVQALEAEGVTGLMSGYTNIHLLPMYQKQIAYGNRGFPWTSDICHRPVDYKKGICPIAEKLHDETFLGIEMCLNELQEKDILSLLAAFEKVWNNLELLK